MAYEADGTPRARLATCVDITALVINRAREVLVASPAVTVWRR
jgi:hypothetical protein